MVNFHRNVHCLMGLPIDALSLPEAAQALIDARSTRKRCFFSTPNLNFVVASQRNSKFRDSVSVSDLSLADGMPLVWVAKLLGVPLRGRVSGSDLFDFLRKKSPSAWNVFFFGGPKGRGQDACLAIGDKEPVMRTTGYIYPGFVDVEQMSRPELISDINHSNADMVVVALGASKGQEWICRNRDKLEAPVIGHLGAVINFVAGSVKRAPTWMQRTGLEWIWRILEERSLLRRYLLDGLAFIGLVAKQIIPLAILQWRNTPKASEYLRASISHTQRVGHADIQLHGAWCAANLRPVRAEFTRLERLHQSVTIDMADVSAMDSAFIGLLLLMDVALEERGLDLRLTRVSSILARQFHYSGASHLTRS